VSVTDIIIIIIIIISMYVSRPICLNQACRQPGILLHQTRRFFTNGDRKFIAVLT